MAAVEFFVKNPPWRALALPPISWRCEPPSRCTPAPSRPLVDTGFAVYDSRALPADKSWADERLVKIQREHAERQAQMERDRMRDARYCPAPSQSPAWGPIEMERRIEWTLASMRGPGISPRPIL